jgi:ABC-type multidrug transport system ATPase subunit
MMIRAESLTKRYGAVVAVNDLSFEVEAGETFALIGPNGAGKTTTLRILLGLARPDAGVIEIGPERLAPGRLEARHQLGYVPQRVEFPPGRTVAEVLAYFADLRGLSRAAVGAALDRVGLAEHASRRAVELSGGYTQRLSLGQALLGDPMLLVLDEPTASLDPEATWEFRTLLEQLQREGKTVLLCSHLLSEVERVADRVLIMVDGRGVALHRLDELRARQMTATRMVIAVPDPGTAVTTLERRGFASTTSSDSAVVVENADGRGAEVLEALRGAGIAVGALEIQRPTLEETFLDAVREERRR